MVENENSAGGIEKKFQDPTLICYIYLLDEEKLENTRREAINIFQEFCNELGVQCPEPNPGLGDDGFIIRGNLGFVRKIPDHHVVQIIFPWEDESEKFDSLSIMKAWMQKFEEARKYLEKSSYYGVVFYLVNRDLGLPDNFTYRDYGIDFSNSEYVILNNFKIYLPRETKLGAGSKKSSVFLSIISESEEREKEVLLFLKDNLLSFIYSYLVFMDHFKTFSSIFSRNNVDSDNGINSVLILEKEARKLIERYFSKSSKERGKTLTSEIMEAPDMLEEIEELTFELSEYYAKISDNLSMLSEIKNTMEIHYLNMHKTTQGQYRLNFPSLVLELDKTLKQVDFDIKYSEAFLTRISKTLESVKLNLDVIRSGASFRIQKESLKIQRASEVIEFVVVLYYFTRIWEHYSHETHEALGIFSFIIAVAFSATVTFLTDKLIDLKFWEKKKSKTS